MSADALIYAWQASPESGQQPNHVSEALDTLRLRLLGGESKEIEFDSGIIFSFLSSSAAGEGLTDGSRLNNSGARLSFRKQKSTGGGD